jgi:hypothetical protein
MKIKVLTNANVAHFPGQGAMLAGRTGTREPNKSQR